MQKLRTFLFRFPIWVQACVFCGFLVVCVWVFESLLKHNLKPIILLLGKATGQQLNVHEVTWKDGDYIKLVDLDFGDIARVNHLDVRVSALGLIKGEIDEVRIHGGRVWLSKLIGSENDTKKGGSLLGITIKKLVVSNTTIYLDNLGNGLPSIPLTLAEVPPSIIMNDLHFGGTSFNPSARIKQTATIENFVIYSPYDPAAKVLSFDRIELEFSLAGLESKQIDKLIFDTPTIYVGPDLFWFADEIKKKQTDAPAQPTKAWKIGEFALKNGRIMISAHGQGALPLPGSIEVSPTPLELGDFSKLHLETKFSSYIPEKSYPEYGVKFKNLQGDLSFNLPLGAKNPRANLVRQFTVEELEWKGLKFGKKGSPVWIVLTFDEKGVYCKLGAPSYGGYINGTVDIFLDQQMKWVASASAIGVDVAPITKLLSPDDFVMTGKVNTVFKVNGLSREILGIGGFARLPESGVLKINAVQDMLAKIPKDWTQIKQDLSRISMQAFEQYNYTSGNLEFSVVPPNSFMRLNLDGLQGKRDFEIRWRDERSKSTSLIIPENSTVIQMSTVQSESTQ